MHSLKSDLTRQQLLSRGLELVDLLNKAEQERDSYRAANQTNIQTVSLLDRKRKLLAQAAAALADTLFVVRNTVGDVAGGFKHDPERWVAEVQAYCDETLEKHKELLTEARRVK